MSVSANPISVLQDQIGVLDHCIVRLSTRIDIPSYITDAQIKVNVGYLEDKKKEFIETISNIMRNEWKEYPKERPKEYGDYWVYRAGCDKQHKEVWNNTGWAYNNNDITHWKNLPETPKKK